MAEETPTGQNPAGNEPVNQTGTPAASTPQPAQPAPTPAATGKDEPGTTPEPIRDETAFYKAEAEKKERLFQKAQSQLEELQTKLQNVENEAVKKIQDDYAALVKELEDAKNESAKNALEAQRVKALADAGLKPEDWLEFITGTDDDAIKAQVTKLSEKIPQRGVGQGAKTGNAGPTPRPSGANKIIEAINSGSGSPFDPDIQRASGGWSVNTKKQAGD